MIFNCFENVERWNQEVYQKQRALRWGEEEARGEGEEVRGDGEQGHQLRWRGQRRWEQEGWWIRTTGFGPCLPLQQGRLGFVLVDIRGLYLEYDEETRTFIFIVQKNDNNRKRENIVMNYYKQNRNFAIYFYQVNNIVAYDIIVCNICVSAWTLQSLTW